MASHSDKQANVPPRYLEPPPFRGFFLTRGPSGPIPLGVSKSKRRALWVPLRGALEWHLSAVNRWGRPYAGWEPFERDLATEFGLLLLILASA